MDMGVLCVGYTPASRGDIARSSRQPRATWNSIGAERKDGLLHVHV